MKYLKLTIVAAVILVPGSSYAQSGKKRLCNFVAEMAEIQNETFETLRCERPSGPDLRTNRRGIVSWCIRRSQQQIFRVLTDRTAAIRSCAANDGYNRGRTVRRNTRSGRSPGDAFTCPEYARKASRIGETLNRGKCRSKWSADYEVHLRRCDRSDPERISDRLTNAIEDLNRCTTYKSRARFIGDCNSYAHEVITLARVAEINKCGFAGPRWALDHDLHDTKCTNLSRNRRSSNLTSMRADIRQCISRWR